MRQKEVGNQHRLGASQVCVGRHDGVTGGRGSPRERSDQADDLFLYFEETSPHIQPEIERDLFVARAARVQTFSDLADPLHQLPFDKRVYVLIGTGQGLGSSTAVLPNLGQSAPNRRRLFGRQNAGSGECLDPGQAALDVVFEQLTSGSGQAA